jgi:hypothetical protein
MQLKRAQRKKVKLKVGFSGASGFGKTYSALLMAYGVTGDWSKIAVIDTENGSADLYSDLGEYNTLTLEPPFSPERYIDAIKTCEDAGMELVIIDSITHEWDGEGGCLEIYDKLGGRYQDWSKVTPRHKKFINAILQSKCHVFTTVRRKQDYDMVKNDNGRLTVQKAGTKEITREGFEYEITLNFEFVNDKHMVKASKDRTGLFADEPEFVITSETGKKLMTWADSGVDPLQYAIKSISESQNIDELKTIWTNNKKFQADTQFVMAKDKRKGELSK